jgi:hypothetical protein
MAEADPRGEQKRANEMNQDKCAKDLKSIAAEAFTALGGARQIAPFSSRSSDSLSVDDAYRVTPLVRQMYEAGGARALGRKIGFTNRTIWAQYGVYAPIWGYVFDRTVHDLADAETLPLAPFSEPRIEPEILFGLSAAPRLTWTRRHCRLASDGSRSASRSCNRSIRDGNFPRPIRLRPTAYMEP